MHTVARSEVARALSLHATRERWWDDAACKGMGCDLFYPERGDVAAHAAAIAVCQRCPVIRECLADAVEHHEVLGIRAGIHMSQYWRAANRCAEQVPTDPGWGRPRKAWSQLSPRGRAAWSARGAPYGLSGRRAYDWARARPSTRRRYEAYGRRYGLTDLEVYREPELVRAERRKRRPGDVSVPMLAFPWRYGQAELYDNAESLQRAATTRWGLLILERQEPPAQRRWAFVEPDAVPFLGANGPWHSSGAFRDLDDAAAFQRDTGIDWLVLVYVRTPGAFVWSRCWPDYAYDGQAGARHPNGKEAT